MSKKTFNEKITALRAYYSDEDSLNTLAKKEKELRTLVVSTELRENNVIKQIIEATRKHIGGIDLLLQQDEEMPEDTRKKLFIERKVHQFHLERLGGDEAQKRIESIERFLDDKLVEVGIEDKEAGDPS